MKAQDALLLFFWVSLLSIGRSVYAEPSLGGLSSFAYQLQTIDTASLAAAPYDLFVIDYSSDGTQRGAFTRDQIRALTASGKTVLAYMSIGEAERYRFYFKSSWVRRASRGVCRTTPSTRATSWLDAANPHYCDNYKVRYWHRSWRRTIYGIKSGRKKSYLDRILDAGFNGVYLDVIDAYEYWVDRPGNQRRRSAARDMAQLVIDLAHYAREKRGESDFVVVPQNGAEIILRISGAQRAQYLRTIQGIGAEDTFFFGGRDEDNRFAPQPVIEVLDRYIAADKKVFALDYLLDASKVDHFARVACARGYIPQVSNRALDTLTNHALVGCMCVAAIHGSVC